MNDIQRQQIQPKPIGYRGVQILLLAAFAVALLVRDIGGIPISKYLLTALLVSGFCFSGFEGILAMLCFLAPLSSGVSYTMITFIAVIALLCSRKGKVSCKLFPLLVMTTILVLELVSGFGDSEFSFMDFFRFTGFLLLLLLVLSNLEKMKACRQMLSGYLAGFVLMTVDLFGQLLRQSSLDELLKQGVRLGNMREALDITAEGQLISLNPNTLGLFAVVGVAVCLLLYADNGQKRFLLIGFYAAVIGVLSQSRAFLFTLAAVFVFFLFATAKSTKQFLLNLLKIGLMLALLWGVVAMLFPAYPQSFLARFTEVADITNGRLETAEQYTALLLADWRRFLFGVGLQGYGMKYGSEISLHNATLELLAVWGVVGFTGVTSLLLTVLFQLKKRVRAFYFLPLLAFFLAIQAGHGFAVWSNILLFLVCLMGAKLGDKQDETTSQVLNKVNLGHRMANSTSLPLPRKKGRTPF